MAFKRASKAAAAALALIAPAGCAMFGDRPAAPAWFDDRVAELKKQRYPQLAAVPAATPPSRTPQAWDEVRDSVEAAGAALEANPRAAPPSGGDAAAGEFEAAARRAAETQRPER
jgi:hypothetical protein